MKRISTFLVALLLASSTRLGKVADMSADEMAELLGNGDVTITLSK